ncbi:MAG: DUF2141 domain-containing protein [Cytophagales bacterium]|nr:DUF2141 domain-containing protein [Armatimonadota bacterium]
MESTSFITKRHSTGKGVPVAAVLVLAGASWASAPSQPPPPAEIAPRTVRLVVQVTGMRNDKGRIAATLFDQEKGFPGDDSRAVARQISPVKDRSATLRFDGLKAGSYALALLHDENTNSKMDTNLFGFPREGYGASNNPRPSRRGPRFTEARFVVSGAGEEQAIQVKVVYLRLGDIVR